MSELSSNIILVILVTSLATYMSRFLGVVSSEKINLKYEIKAGIGADSTEITFASGLVLDL